MNSTPRSPGDIPLASLHNYSYTSSSPPQQPGASASRLTRTYASHPNEPTSTSWSLQGSAVPGYNTRGVEIANYLLQQPSNSPGVGSPGDQVNVGLSYATQSFGFQSPQSFASANASTTTPSGSPYPPYNHTTQSDYGFTPASARQSHYTTINRDTGQPSQYPGPPGPRHPVTSLPTDVQSTIQSLDRRYIQTNLTEEFNYEKLDARKHLNIGFEENPLTCTRISASGTTISCDIFRAWPSKLDPLFSFPTILTR